MFHRSRAHRIFGKILVCLKPDVMFLMKLCMYWFLLLGVAGFKTLQVRDDGVIADPMLWRLPVTGTNETEFALKILSRFLYRRKMIVLN